MNVTVQEFTSKMRPLKFRLEIPRKTLPCTGEDYSDPQNPVAIGAGIAHSPLGPSGLYSFSRIRLGQTFFESSEF